MMQRNRRNGLQAKFTDGDDADYSSSTTTLNQIAVGAVVVYSCNTL